MKLMLVLLADDDPSARVPDGRLATAMDLTADELAEPIVLEAMTRRLGEELVALAAEKGRGR